MRVLVCRAGADSEATARALAANGHEAVVAPVLDVRAVAAQVPDRDIDAVLMTSAQAAALMLDDQARGILKRPLFTVGPQTAAAARARGFQDIRIGQGDGAMLVDLLRLTLRPAARLLYLAGRVRKPETEELLRLAGYNVRVVEIYEAVPAEAWGPDIVAPMTEGSIVACLHFSKRSAALALAFAEAATLMKPFRQLHHLCISGDAAEPLLQAGMSRVSIASQPNEVSLLRLLDPA